MTHPRPSVLIVEDSDEDYDTLQEAVRRAGLPADLRRAVTGDECLAVLRGVGAEAVRPALVLLDLNTPDTDGRETLEEMKADPALRRYPVVVFSTSNAPQDLAHCYGLGANAYYVKPVRYTDHLQLVTDVLTYWLSHVALPRAADDEPT